jgi:hypothetical protein
MVLEHRPGFSVEHGKGPGENIVLELGVARLAKRPA